MLAFWCNSPINNDKRFRKSQKFYKLLYRTIIYKCNTCILLIKADCCGNVPTCIYDSKIIESLLIKCNFIIYFFILTHKLYSKLIYYLYNLFCLFCLFCVCFISSFLWIFSVQRSGLVLQPMKEKLMIANLVRKTN